MTKGTAMRRTMMLVTIAAALLSVSGCSQKYSAEQDGKKLGEAVCDLREATTVDDKKAAISDIDEQVDDLASKYSMFTAEDRADVQNNLADLAEHSVQGNEVLLQQDLAVIERSVDNIRSDVNEVSSAAWDGVLEGLAECSQ